MEDLARTRLRLTFWPRISFGIVAIEWRAAQDIFSRIAEKGRAEDRAAQHTFSRIAVKGRAEGNYVLSQFARTIHILKNTKARSRP